MSQEFKAAPLGRKYKPTEVWRRQEVILIAIRKAKMKAAKQGRHDAVRLLDVAMSAMSEETLTAIYEEVRIDRTQYERANQCTN